MTTSGRADVHWVPGMSDHLVTWSTNLKLYKIFPVGGPPTSSSFPNETERPLWAQAPKSTFVNEAGKLLHLSEGLLKVSPTSIAELQCQIPEPPNYIKCLAVHPLPGRHGDVRVAVGQANGRVSLLSFVPQMSGHSIKEFGPKQGGRPCNTLAWNKLTPEFLAAGFEKNRNDSAILIFDAGRNLPPPAEFQSVVPNASAASSIFKAPSKDSTTLPSEFIRASIEIGFGETCHSLSWFFDHPDTIVAGMNSKNLKVFDVRCCDGSSTSGRKPSTSNFTRSVYGVCVDPFMDYRLASHYDNNVVIWDTRNFDRPIVTLIQQNTVSKLSWCPTRSGLLCSVIGNSSALTLHDVQSWAVMSEDGEPVVTERNVECHYINDSKKTEEEDENSEVTLSFAWHPTEESVIMAIGKEGKLAECHVPDRITPSWSARHCLLWPQKGILRSFGRDVPLCRLVNDISVTMEDRARQGCYTTKVGTSSLEPLLEPSVLSAWVWLEECGKLMQDLNFRNKFPRTVTFPGVRTALGLESRAGLGPRSDIVYRYWNLGGPDPKAGKPKKTFRSAGRENALKLCGWSPPDSEPDLKKFLKSLQDSGQHSRAATIAVFCLEIKLALQILQLADETPSLRIVAVALSGFSQENASIWRESVSAVTDHLTDPYIRAMFAFLLAVTSGSPEAEENYAVVLHDPNLKISDKISLACLYLSDDSLAEYVNEYWKEALENGYLCGLFLCGMTGSQECVELIQRYLDLTGDVQTASWLAVKAMPHEMASNSDTVQVWISSYRSLLDAWGLWSARAEFDIALHKAGINKNHPQQVYVSCNFCGSSVSQQVKRIAGGVTNNIVPEVKKSEDDGSALNVILKGAIDFIGLPKPKKPVLQSPQTNNLQMQQKNTIQNKNVATQRSQSCPACRKPLPRCSVCLIHMGGVAPATEGGFSSKRRAKPFSHFFTWCQTCRHGGHASHLIDWFHEHQECPVNGCTCRCSSLDSALNIERAFHGNAVNGQQSKVY